MNSQARVAYGVSGVGFVFIGALHTWVHLNQLTGSVLEERFRQFGTIDLGQPVEAWDLFQGLSLLMGFFSIAVGLIDLALLRATPHRSPPPLGAAMANVAMLTSIVVVGMLYLGPLQVYGGLFGIAAFSIGIMANLRPNPNPVPTVPDPRPSIQA